MHESLRRDSLRPPADRLAGFRHANDRIASSAKEGFAIFVCECGLADCLSTLALDVAVYEKIRSNPAWALFVPGHELEDGERVVAEGASFLVVERGSGSVSTPKAGSRDLSGGRGSSGAGRSGLRR